MWTKDYARMKTVAVSAGKRFSFEKARGYIGVVLIFLGIAYGGNIAAFLSGGFNQSVVFIDPSLTRGVTVGLVVLGGYLMAIDLIRRIKAS